MTVVPFTDVEGAVRAWLRTVPDSTVGARVYFAVPDGNPTMPLATVARVTGGMQPDGVLEDVVLTVDVWARTKEEAARAYRLLAAAIVKAEGVALDAGTWCHGASVNSVVWLPDPVTKTPRYSLTVVLTVEAQELP